MYFHLGILFRDYPDCLNNLETFKEEILVNESTHRAVVKYNKYIFRLDIQIQPHSNLSANTKLCDLPLKFRSGRILLYANNDVRIQVRNDTIVLLDTPNDLHYDCFVVGFCNDIS